LPRQIPSARTCRPLCPRMRPLSGSNSSRPRP